MGKLLRGTLLVALCATAAAQAAEQAGKAAGAYPARPIRFVVAQTAGGNADFVARSYAQRLSERLGQQFVIDNRAGGGGVIGSEVVARALPDGYTLLLAPTSHGINPALMAKLPFDARRDFTPISLLALGPNLLVFHNALPAKNVQELLAAVRAQPGRLRFSSSGVASSPHLAGELFKFMTGLDMQHVAYKGGPAAVVAVVSGESEVSFASMPSALPLVRSGRLRAIAVTSAKRWPPLPELPTVAESGIPGYENSIWQAMFAPAKLPQAIVDRLHREIAEVAKLPDLRERLMADGSEPLGTTPQELAEFVGREIAKWQKVVKAANLKAE
jgi:tripartite-type tricarboxylate transporter receptor subunit TctC